MAQLRADVLAYAIGALGKDEGRKEEEKQSERDTRRTHPACVSSVRKDCVSARGAQNHFASDG